MNSRPDKIYLLLAKTLGLLCLVLICNTASAVKVPEQATNAASAQTDIECVFNWAQTFYPNLLSPPVSGVQSSPPYTYRYYPDTHAYLGVSSADNHVYYLGPEGTLQDVGDLSAVLAVSGCGARPYPVIFIHGLASSADTWTAYRDYLISNAFWTFGGIPAYDQTAKTVGIGCPSGSSVQCTGSAGDFYTLNFSDTQGLSFDVQGGELAAIVKAVLAANPGKTKVLLISHSIGGLAAREYLQGLARELNAATTIPYGGDVAKLITIGTSHQGSFWAEACHNPVDIPVGAGICDLLPLPIDSNSLVIQDLQPGSPALNSLNDLAAHPLPADIAYVSIIATGQSTLTGFVDFSDGDGVVSDVSQDLAMVSGNLAQHKSVRINVPFQACGNKITLPIVGDIGETHTCETTDIGIGAEVLRDLQ